MELGPRDIRTLPTVNRLKKQPADWSAAMIKLLLKNSSDKGSD